MPVTHGAAVGLVGQEEWEAPHEGGVGSDEPLRPATPTFDFDEDTGASIAARSYQGAFDLTNVTAKARGGSHLSVGYYDQMGHVWWPASNVDQEWIVGDLRAMGNIGGAGMFGIALLDDNYDGVGAISYTDGNCYLANIVNGQYQSSLGAGTISNFGRTTSHVPIYEYWMKLTRVGNLWDFWLSVDGSTWAKHSTSTGSKTITVSKKAFGLFYDTNIANRGRLTCDWLHTVLT